MHSASAVRLRVVYCGCAVCLAHLFMIAVSLKMKARALQFCLVDLPGELRSACRRFMKAQAAPQTWLALLFVAKVVTAPSRRWARLAFFTPPAAPSSQSVVRNALSLQTNVNAGA